MCRAFGDRFEQEADGVADPATGIEEAVDRAPSVWEVKADHGGVTGLVARGQL